MTVFLPSVRSMGSFTPIDRSALNLGAGSGVFTGILEGFKKARGSKESRDKPNGLKQDWVDCGNKLTCLVPTFLLFTSILSSYFLPF